MPNPQTKEPPQMPVHPGPANRGAFSHLLYSEDLRDADPRWREPVWLYRYFNDCDVLLYVGISFAPLMRDAAHYRKTAWRHAAKRMTAELFPSRTLAELAEEHAIHNEEPIVNAKRMEPCPYSGVTDAWFIDQQGGLIGTRITEFEIDGPRLAVKVARALTDKAHGSTCPSPQP